jgi:hypothetical protein
MDQSRNRLIDGYDDGDDDDDVMRDDDDDHRATYLGFFFYKAIIRNGSVIRSGSTVKVMKLKLQGLSLHFRN